MVPIEASLRLTDASGTTILLHSEPTLRESAGFGSGRQLVG